MTMKGMRDWRTWMPAAMTGVGIVLGLATAVQEFRLETLARRDTAAIVNGHPILREDFDRAVIQLGTDRRAQMTPEDKAKVLERLIEDELLAQRAVALGLGLSDPNARKVLVRGLIDSVVSAASDPTPTELHAYFDAHRKLFRTPDLIGVAPAAGAVAPGLPTTPMTIDKLKDYLGGDAEKLLTLRLGDRTGPFRFAGATFDLVITSHQGGAQQSFEQALADVTARFAFDRDGQRLRAYIQGLKQSAKIERLE